MQTELEKIKQGIAFWKALLLEDIEGEDWEGASLCIMNLRQLTDALKRLE